MTVIEIAFLIFFGAILLIMLGAYFAMVLHVKISEYRYKKHLAAYVAKYPDYPKYIEDRDLFQSRVAKYDRIVSELEQTIDKNRKELSYLESPEAEQMEKTIRSQKLQRRENLFYRNQALENFRTTELILTKMDPNWRTLGVPPKKSKKNL